MLDFLNKKDNEVGESKEEEMKVLPYHEFWFTIQNLDISILCIGIIGLLCVYVFPHFLPDWKIIYDLKHNYKLISIFMYGTITSGLILLALRMTVMKMPKFDDWIFDIAQKHLSSEYLWYKKEIISLDFDRNLNKKDILDFVRELSNKSEHYTYYFVDIKMDEGIVILKPTKKREIPTRATINVKTDTAWNIIPLGEAVNHELRDISPICWWLNDNIEREDVLKTLPSTSMLVAGGTGSGKSVLQNCVVGHISRHADHFMAIGGDVKMVEFNSFVGVAGFKNIALTLETVQKSVNQARNIMYDRFAFMKDNGVNNVYKVKAEVDYYELNGKSYQFDEIFTCKVDGEEKILKIEEIFKLVEEEDKEVEIDEEYGKL